jgi:hypothetical protein
MALHLFFICCGVEGGLPMIIKLKMVGNIVFDLILGLFPVLGDVFDAIFQANIRNAKLLDRHLAKKASLESQLP